jgi:predicted nucleotidyltransferase
MKVKGQEDYEVHYTPDHWQIFRDLRKRAIHIAEIFANQGFDMLAYGSIARGDVKITSDIDLILQQLIPTYRVELILEQANIPILQRKLVQATPNDVIKANFQLEDEVTVTVLLTNPNRLPFEFYRFGGAVTYTQMLEEIRVPGVDKQLLLIQPTPTGHHALSIIESPQIAAQSIGISNQIVEERIRVLTRRDKIGRTGVFLNQVIPPDSNCEEFLHELAKKNSFIRRRMANG